MTFSPSPITKPTQDLLHRTRALLEAAERNDLLERMETAETRVRTGGCTILIVGEFKMGKSSLVNGLVNAPLCPVDDGIATARPMQVGHADEPTAELVYRLKESDDEAQTKVVPFETIEDYVLEPPQAPDAQDVSLVRVGLPRNLFSKGLSVIDSPGVGGIGSAHSAQTLALVPMADAVLFVSDAAQELTAPELEFLQHVHEICPLVSLVMPKVDYYPEFSRIADINRGHLENAGFDIPIFGISSTIRDVAIRMKSKELNAESGYEALVAHLREREQEVQRHGLAEFGAVIAQIHDDLGSQLDSERRILDDPDHAAAAIAEIEAQISRAEELRSKAAKWSQTMEDGYSDVYSDIDHDLRARFKTISRDAEAQLDDDDPARIWDDFAASVSEQVNRSVVLNNQLLHQGIKALAERVGDHFEEQAGEVLLRTDHTGPVGLAAAPDFAEARISTKESPFGSAFTLTKGGMSGMIMVGVFGPIMLGGAALAMPATLAVAGIMAHKTRRDELKRGVEKRQREGKMSIRKYIDDALFVASKESRDVVRHSKRNLRDHFHAMSVDLNSATKQTLEAAQQTRQATTAQRQNRSRLVDQLQTQLQVEREHLHAFGAAL